MGMDVFGKQPTSETGEYFRRNVWGWRPLADLCLELEPEICAGCEYWQSNDGDGLNAEGSMALARALSARLEAGEIKAMVAIRDAEIAAMPRETCDLCDGTGIRTDEVGRAHGQDKKVIDEEGHPRNGQTGWCNGCNGRGDNPPSQASYHVDEDDVRQWVAFLEACGGFEIC